MAIWNIAKTTLFLGALTGLFLAVGAFFGGTSGMAVALVLAVALNLGTWWFSDTLALRMHGARPASPEAEPWLHSTVASLAGRAGIPVPRIYIVESEMPNAFATGRSPSKGAVAVTTGIMRLLPPDELAGVLAHEIAHIKHRDTLIASMAATVAGAVTFMAEMAQWALIFSGFGGSDEDEEGSGMVGGLAMVFLAPIAALLIQLAISRSREYGADATGAALLGDSRPLASALVRLETALHEKPVVGNPAAAHLYIVSPVLGGLGGLFRTHPPTAKRVARLRSMEQPAAVPAFAR